MPRIHRTRLWALLALLLATTLVTSDAEAVTGDCEVIALDGTTRECTFTEEIGQCAWNAFDSYSQCINRAWEDYGESRWRLALAATGCELGYYADLTACGVSQPIDLLFH